MFGIEITPALPQEKDYQPTTEPGGSKIDIVVGFILNTLFS